MQSLAPGSTPNAQDVEDTDLRSCCHALDSELSMMAGSRVLVTGGAGFLGYYLVGTLTRWNQEVPPHDRISLTVIDNHLHRGPSNFSESRHDGALVVEHDVTLPLPADIGDFEYFIHAASIDSPTFYRQHPIATMDANVTGLRLLLEQARDQQRGGRQVRGFLFFSGSEVYGNAGSAGVRTHETQTGYASCTDPHACFYESKRYGETLCVNFARQYGLPVTIVRPFNNYGPGLSLTDRRLVSSLARSVLSGADIELQQNGSPSGTFCYVADGVVGYYKTLVRGRPGEAYNIGVETPELTIDEFATQLADAGRELFGYSGRVRQRPDTGPAEPSYLLNRQCPDIGKARAELGFQPQIRLNEGLRRVLLWFADARGDAE